jgi:transposase-like protein
LSKGEFSRKIVCTQTIVDIMLKDPETSGYSARRSHRTYTPEFKGQLVAACQQPGVSIAALAGQHGMNANVLHRWLKEHAQSARHQINPASPLPVRIATSPPAGFVPLPLPLRLPAASHEPGTPALTVKLRKGALSMSITWPIGATHEFTQWAAALLR